MNCVSSPARHDRQGYVVCCLSRRTKMLRQEALRFVTTSCLKIVRHQACDPKICLWLPPSSPT